MTATIVLALAAIGALRVLRLTYLAVKACATALRNAFRAVLRAAADNSTAASKATTKADVDPAMVAAVLEAIRVQKRTSKEGN